MLLTGLQYQSVLVTLIRFQHVRKSEASFIRISPHNGACFHVENSTRLLLIRYFNHLLCSTFGPTVPLWRVIKRLWSSSRRKNSWHCSGEVGDGPERKPGRSQEWVGPVGPGPGRGATCAHRLYHSAPCRVTAPPRPLWASPQGKFQGGCWERPACSALWTAPGPRPSLWDRPGAFWGF